MAAGAPDELPGAHVTASARMVNPLMRSLRCEPCWIGRTVAAAALALWSVVGMILWHFPGVPGIDVWRGWVWLFSGFAVAVSAAVFTWSFFLGCATCTIVTSKRR